MDVSTKYHMNKMYHVAKFVINSEKYGLKLQPRQFDGNWKLVALSDNYFSRTVIQESLFMAL